MNRGCIIKLVLGGLVSLAAVDAAQAGLIFRRGWRNDCCCDGYYSYGRSNGCCYAAPAYSYGYANNNCCAPGGTMVAMGMAPAPYTAAYADPNAVVPLNSGSLTGDKTRMRVQVPTSEARVWVDQQFVPASGTERSIDVPLPVPGGQKSDCDGSMGQGRTGCCSEEGCDGAKRPGSVGHFLGRGRLG